MCSCYECSFFDAERGVCLSCGDHVGVNIRDFGLCDFFVSLLD